jgi:pullulanase
MVAMKRIAFGLFAAMALMVAGCGGTGSSGEAAKSDAAAAAPAGQDVPLPEGHAGIHYFRADGKYDGWGIHLWGPGLSSDVIKATTWQKPFPFAGFDSFGAYAHIKMHPKGAGKPIQYIIHKGDTKDQNGKDMLMDTKQGNEIWIVAGDVNIYYKKEDAMAAIKK